LSEDVGRTGTTWKLWKDYGSSANLVVDCYVDEPVPGDVRLSNWTGRESAPADTSASRYIKNFDGKQLNVGIWRFATQHPLGSKQKLIRVLAEM
jgi:hypothetical protein